MKTTNFPRFSIKYLFIMLIALPVVGFAQNGGERLSQKNSFTIELLKQVAAEEGNQFIGDASIVSTLGMLLAGADGGTRAELLRVVAGNSPEEEFHRAFADALSSNVGDAGPDGFVVSNSLWIQDGISVLAPFQATLKQSYQAGVMLTNFRENAEGSRVKINRWVSSQTNNKIIDLIPIGGLTSETLLVLTNAISFKGKWVTEFEKAKTKSRDFVDLVGKAHETLMMSRLGNMPYTETVSAQVLELAYADSPLGMLIIVPKSKNGLPEVLRMLSPEWIESARKSLFLQQVDLRLPKFKFSSPQRLSKILPKLGLPSAFNESADFSRMTRDSNLYVSEIFHEAFISVDEVGTEAAAASAALMVPKGLGIRPKLNQVYVDRPSLFLILNRRTGFILFSGILKDPTKF